MEPFYPKIPLTTIQPIGCSSFSSRPRLLRPGRSRERFTFGLGQLNGDEAPEVEILAAQIEGRAVKPQAEVAQDVLTVLGSIRYTAAFIRRAQDAYAKEGLDIRGRPEVLVSLYNMGLTINGRSRAEITKEEGREPKLSYLGLLR